MIVIIRNNQKKQREFKKLNQELQKKLLLINDMNRIEFRDLKFERKNKKSVILGKGI
jgi:hypothetical protein